MKPTASGDTAEERAQATAREYFRTRGTEAPLAVVRGRVAAAFEAFEAVIGPVEAATSARRAWDGEWSVHEVVDHLMESHRASLDELRCLLAGRRPPGPPVPAGLQSKAPLARPWPWLVRELKTVHRDVLAALDGVPAGFDTDARAALVMVVNVDDGGPRRPFHWIEELDWKSYAVVSYRLHTIDHMNQIKKVAAALGAPAPPAPR